jgi:2-polyprenyl-3-methyl-5-hydroxy-6-metoxy-1,4-benzoquinol methylase
MERETEEKIEILSVDLLDRHRAGVNALKRTARSLNLEFGWHYLLDLTWIIDHLGPVKGRRILDAGAGTGVLQWHLAELGADVLSVDRGSRANLPSRFRSRYHVTGLRKGDLAPSVQVFQANLQGPAKLPAKVSSQARELIGLAEPRRAPGRVTIYNQDLKCLEDIASDSLDAVVAVSALEHNSPEDLPLVVAELLRVLKPGGMLLATLGAARDQDWFHEASQGWCYTEASLRRLFGLPSSARSNYSEYDHLMDLLRNNRELQDGLAGFYYRSGDNGMPWGIWDPKYQSVGVKRVKKAEGV